MRPGIWLSALLAATTVFPYAQADGGNRGGRYAQGIVSVRLVAGTDVNRFNRDYKTRVVAEDSDHQLYRLSSTRRGANAQALARQMLRDARVSIAEPDFNTDVTEQWTSTFDGGRGRVLYGSQTAVSQVGYDAAVTHSTGEGVIVAVLDTGISRRHAGIAGQTLAGWDFTTNTANSDDAPLGLDTNGNRVRDEAVGHGTGVAGLIARFAPGAQLLPVKVLDSDGIGTAWIAAAGVRYAISRGARVLNLSLGIQGDSKVLEEAIKEARDAGAVVVTSAGNRNSGIPQFPAGYDVAVTVAAVNADNTKAAFSSYGRHVDLVAPGVDIVSTFWDGTFAAWSGTSFAAPIVASEITLIFAIAPDLHPDKAIEIALETAMSVDPFNPRYRELLGEDGGLINFDAAVQRALSEDDAEDNS